MSAWLLSDQRASGVGSESASPAQVIELELAACKALALNPSNATEVVSCGPGIQIELVT